MKRTIIPITTLLLALTGIATGQDLSRLQRLVDQRRHEEALPALRSYVTANPKDADGWVALGRAYFQASKGDSAEWAGRQALAVNPKVPLAHLVVAFGMSLQKRCGEALDYARPLVLKNPNPVAFALYSALLLSCDSVKAAILIATVAQNQDPNLALTNEALGDAYMAQNTPAMAIISYENALRLDSLRPDIRYKMAKALIKEQRFGEAGQMYIALLQQDSTNTLAMLDLGKIYFAAQKYGASALWLGKYLAAMPGTPEIRSIYLNALYLSKQYKELIPVSLQVLAADPKATKALRYLAIAHFNTSNYQEAVLAYERLQTLDTLGADEYQTIGKAQAQLGKDSLAVLAYEEALKREPANTEFLGDAGSAYMRLKSWEKAASMFERRFTADPSSAASYLNYAQCNMFLGRWDPARGALLRLTALKPDYVPGFRYLGDVYSQMDSLAAARAAYTAVTKIAAGQEEKYANDLASAYGGIGIAYLLEKKYPPAIEALTSSIKHKDDNPQTRLWRAQAYALANRRDEAIKEFKVVLKLDPKNKDAKKGLESLGQ